MARLLDFDPVAFLVSRKFRSAVYEAIWSGGTQAWKPIPPLNASQSLIREQYRTALEAMPEAEFQILLDAEQQKLGEELKAKSEREEEQRFFNQPHACADLEHWSKTAHWTLDEAVALSFGKSPDCVNWMALQPVLNVSPFAHRYARLRDLARRATSWGKLFDPVSPLIFVSWAKENDIEFPVALAEKVHARGGYLIDWRKEYEKLRATYDNDAVQLKKLDEKQTELINENNSRIDSLQSELKQYRANADTALPSPPPEKPQSSREREGMLKVIYAMAVGGYAFDPAKDRSTTVPEIKSDLELQGLLLSDDTIRRYLSEACDLLPEWKEASR